MTTRARGKPDVILLFCIVLLVLAGLLALSSASSAESQKMFGNIYGYLLHQLFYGVFFGGIAALIFYRMPYAFLRSYAFFFFLAAIFLLILVFIPPFGHSSGGAQRWIEVGGFTVQPSEFAKLAFIIYLAAWIDARKKEVKMVGEGLVPFLFIVGTLGAFLILQPDIGTLGVILLVAFIMYLAGGGGLNHFAIIAVLVAGLAGMLVQGSSYRLHRILAFFNPQIDPQGISYQINQAFLALGSGGPWGRGIGYSGQKLGFLPEPMEDSIFAVWGEETGFVGAVFLVGLFLLFFWRGLRIARASDDRFAFLIVIGIISWICLQAFINMGAIIGLLPLTGIPLPFVSYGGTAMIAVLAASGLLLQLSRYSK